MISWKISYKSLPAPAISHCGEQGWLSVCRRRSFLSIIAPPSLFQHAFSAREGAGERGLYIQSGLQADYTESDPTMFRQ